MPDFKTKAGVVVVELSGVAKLLSRLKEAETMYLDSEVRAAYDGAAKGLARAAKAQAPVSKYPYASNRFTKRTSSVPGLLRRAIVGKAFNLTAWRRWGPGSYSQVNLSKKYAVRAPHANIIQPGRKALEPVKAKRLAFLGSDGRMRFMKRVAAVPANDFWNRGIRAGSSLAIDLAKRSLERAWNRRAAK